MIARIAADIVNRMQVVRIACFASLLLAGSADAHMDRILTLQDDGSIPEIPESFGRVFLKISGLGTSTPAVEFDVGGHRNILQSCLTRFIHTQRLQDVKITGSWYHDESIVPFYLIVEFPKQGLATELPSNDFLRIMFNLHDARVQELSRIVGGQGQDVGVSNDCAISRPAG